MLRSTVGRKRPVFSGKTRIGAAPAPPSKTPFLDSPSTPIRWRRALPRGVLPAYDEALKLIKLDAARLQKEATALKKQVAETSTLVSKLEGEEKASKEQELEDMRKQQRIMEIQSQVNLPSVRYAVKRGAYDMNNVAHRHLREQQWRNDGKLDLLMERIHQMKVIPDVLPDLRPTIDVTLTVRPPLIARSYKPVPIEPGSYIEPLSTMSPPGVNVTAFHTDTRLYTLLLVDPDVPDEVNETYTTYLHWMCPNVPLSAFTKGPLKGLNTHTRYVPPHPQYGTKYHRYSFLMLPQPPISDYSLSTETQASKEPTSQRLNIPVVHEEQRKDFDVRAFAKRWQLDGRTGGGAHLWRAVHDSTVDTIYTRIFGQEAPRYGIPKKADRYEELRERKKYINV